MNYKWMVCCLLMSIGLSGCSVQNVLSDIHQRPPSIGRLIAQYEDGSISRCRATLVASDAIFGLRHCYVNDQSALSSLTFEVKPEGRSEFDLYPVHIKSIGDNVLPSTLKTAHEDAQILFLMDVVKEVAPMPFFEKKVYEEGLVFDLFISDDQLIKYDWQDCRFSAQSRYPNLLFSQECYYPSGYSGMPLLLYHSGQWHITGIYHGYFVEKITKNRPARHWGFYSLAPSVD